MKKLEPFTRLGFLAILTCSAVLLRAEESTNTIPRLLMVIREKVKPGHTAAHAKNEHDWVTAFEKAKYPYHYMAMTSVTGPREAWYVIPFNSHEQMGEDIKLQDENPLLSAETGRLEMEDAQHVDSANVVTLSSNPQMSDGNLPDPAEMRFMNVETWTIRPGYWGEFQKMLNAYVAARKRASARSGFACYELMGGMAGPAYFFFTPLKSMAEMDKGEKEFEATMGAATEEEKEKIFHGMKEAVTKMESNLFRIDPKQSYMSEETKRKAADFWIEK